jgi:hypothetical protein
MSRGLFEVNLMPKRLVVLLSHVCVLIAFAFDRRAAAVLVDNDPVRRVVTLSDSGGDLVLRLGYNHRCVLEEVRVRGRTVVGEGHCVFSGIRVGDDWFTTRAIDSPTITVDRDALTVSGIRFGDGGVRVEEVWRFSPQGDRIVWKIDRTYLSGGVLEDACLPEWNFSGMSVWTGGLLGTGGVVWNRFLDTQNSSYGVHGGAVSFWNHERRDCLRITPTVSPGAFVASRFSHQPDGAFSSSFTVSNGEVQPRYGLSRFQHRRQDLWAPLEVKPSRVEVTYALQALDYDREYDRGVFKGVDGDAVRELLNTIGRYGVIDRRIMGANGWRTQWTCLHEQWFAQMGLAIDDPAYTDNLAATLDWERDHAIKPDGRVLSRWHDDATDAMAGTFDPKTGFYECKWGYTLDSQPDYVITVAEQFDLSGDLAWLRGQKQACERALDFMLRREPDGDGLLTMMNDSHLQGRCSDWIDVVWASYKNALVNAEMYQALRLWSAAEEVLGDVGRADRFRQAAERLKAGFNRPISEGGFWSPDKGCYVYWRDKDGSVHGDNLVVPVNFCAIAYGLCDNARRRDAILRQIETRMRQEDLFHWPLCFDSYNADEVAAQQRSFPTYENGDIFLSWGEVGVRAYAASEPEIAVKYVKKLLDRYKSDGLSFQRYLRRSQQGAGNDILAGNCMAVVGLYRDIYGIQPKYNRLYLEPHLTADLNGTRIRYQLRGQWYTVDLSTDGSRMTCDGWSIRDGGPFAMNVRQNCAEFFAGDSPTAVMSVTRSGDGPVELGIVQWPSGPDGHRSWTECCRGSDCVIGHVVSGLRPDCGYRVLRNRQGLANVRSDAAGRLQFQTRPTSGGIEEYEISRN